MYGGRAIVIGGGHSGLITARVLSDFFEEVLVLEKDQPQQRIAARKGVPQGTHVHGLQGHALHLLNHYYPGIEADLIEAGAASLDFSKKIRLYLANGWAPPAPPGANGLSMTRPLLEALIREHTTGRENVRLLWQARVTDLLFEGGAVCGVEYALAGGKPTMSDAVLVVDASGRGTRLGQWLGGAGFKTPGVSAIHVDVRYATALYERPAGGDSEVGYVVRHYPMDKLGAAMLPVENDQWLLSLSGRFGVYPGKDPTSFLESAAALPVPEVADTLKDATATTGVSAYTFSHNEVRHFDDDMPVGIMPVGDCVISLNPLYGQGMTSAIAQADLLHQTLASFETSHFDAAHLTARHIPKISAFSAPPWKRAVLGDTIFSEASGDIPEELDAWRHQEKQLNALAAKDPKVANLVFQVAQFAEPADQLDALVRLPSSIEG